MTPEERARKLVQDWSYLFYDMRDSVSDHAAREGLEHNITEAIREAVKEEREQCWDLCDQYAEELLGMSNEGLSEQEKAERFAEMDTARLLARRIREQL